ncbi:DNA adenine methylase, partial [Chloroflexota bacterium]
MEALHPIPYQGSKRKLAPAILAFFPETVCRLIEPFAGSAAVSIAALSSRRVSHVILNDLNEPLMILWQQIIEHPAILVSEYSNLWHDQLGRERQFYDSVRERFNKTKQPSDFLYLLARCVKASVRYNAYGQFNQSPDNRRKGMHPSTLSNHIFRASQLMKGKVTLCNGDYLEVLKLATPDDIVYMDPPYQGVCGNRDPRYLNGLSFDDFTLALQMLNQSSISYIVSYDGRTGSKTYGKALPDSLCLKHVEVSAGRSSQATLLGRNYNTYESLYISPALLSRTDIKGPSSV